MGAQFKNTPGADLLASFGNHLDTINNHLLNNADRPEFQAWLRTQFSPLLQKLGYSGRSTDSPTDKQKRALLFVGLGNIANDPEVIQQANTLVQQYMKNPDSVDGSLAHAVIAVAARHGNAELYNQFKAQLKKASSPEQYYQFFYALSEFQQPELAKQTLDWTLTPEVRGQDLYILLPMLENPASQEATWSFMRTHFDDLLKKTGGGLGGVGIFLYGAGNFCSTEKATEVKQFFEQHPFPGTERNQKQAIESIDNCVALRNQQQSNLSAWLKQQGNATNASNGGAASTGAAMRR
jgi:aminopeptidase N